MGYGGHTAGPLATPPVQVDASLARQVAILDLSNYTKNVLLRDTDAMSMGVSLEVRVPYLDSELVEWTLRLPDEVRAQGRKRLLADAVRDLVPSEVLMRRKHGFLLPTERWMRRELREEIDDTLSSPAAAVARVVDTDAGLRVWRSFESGSATGLRPWSLYVQSRWTRELASVPAAN
jgi:asparagine synthase (glutamine-hydrolysing)